MQFDPRTAKLLKPGEHLTIPDAPGLRLEISETRRAWTYRYKSPLDGRMRQVKIGLWPAMSAGAAWAEWEKLRQAREAGRDPAQERRSARQEARTATEAARVQKLAGAYTVERLCADYMTGHIERNRGETSIRLTRGLFTRMLGETANMPAAQLTRSAAWELLDGHRDKAASAARLRLELAAAWDYALDAGRLPPDTPNWWRLVHKNQLRSEGRTRAGERIGTDKRVLSDDEVGELIRWLPNFSEAVADALALYLWTGVRGGELLAMEVREVTEEADGLWWTLPKKKQKNARHEGAMDLRVPLVGRAEEIVRRRLAAHPKGFLFPSEGNAGHIVQQTISNRVYQHQPYCPQRPGRGPVPQLPVVHWSPHDLRRTVRTMLAALDCPSDVAEAVLGHMQPGVRGIYNRHSYDRQRREWLTKLDAHLERLARA